MSRPQITILPDGPIQIRDAGSVQFCGQSVAVEGDLYLCRCGQSRNAPFCDGSHRTAGFQGTSAAPPTGEVRVWEGRTLRTRFNTAACMHVLYCKPLNALRERELAGDDAAAEEIVRVVRSCPSGALTHEAKGDQAAPAQEALDSTIDIDIMEGGEVRVKAAFDINVPRPAHQPEDRATLCRCGQSASKPWCDGRHRRLTTFR